MSAIDGLSPILTVSVVAALVMLGLAFLLALYRLLRGPSLPDRIVAIDLLGLLAVSAIAVFAVWSGQPVFIDAAIALALVGFFGTVAYARFVELRGRERQLNEAADQKGAGHDD